MPRGRLPNGTVATTLDVPESIIVMSPETSLVTYTLNADDSSGGFCSTCWTGAGCEQLTQKAARHAGTSKYFKLVTDYFPLKLKLLSILPDGATVTFCSCAPSVSCHASITYSPGGTLRISK